MMLARPTRVFDRVCKRSNDTEFESLFGIVALDVHQSPTGKLHCVDFDVGQTGVEVDGPVDKPVGSIKKFALMECDKRFSDGSTQWLGRRELRSDQQSHREAHLGHGKCYSIPVVRSSKLGQLL